MSCAALSTAATLAEPPSKLVLLPVAEQVLWKLHYYVDSLINSMGGLASCHFQDSLVEFNKCMTGCVHVLMLAAGSHFGCQVARQSEQLLTLH